MTLSPHSTANTEATLSPTSGSRRPQRRGGGSRLGSRFRGVTHHSRTARYESHLWDNGTFRFHHDDAPTTIFHTHHDLSTSPHRRQAGVPRRWVLISTDVRSLIARLDSLTRVTRSARSLVRSLVRSSGFNIEAAAALAYDLAGVSYRGTDALLNGRWSLVEKELQCRHTITREDVIQKLRTQSKHMNKINTNGPVMTRTDLLISKCMNPNQEHIGLYCTADDAARAYDRALIERLGGVGIELDRCAHAPTLTRATRFARSPGVGVVVSQLSVIRVR